MSPLPFESGDRVLERAAVEHRAQRGAGTRVGTVRSGFVQHSPYDGKDE